MFDEIHDLIRVDRFRSVGGWSVFSFLANQATLHGVNTGDVRFLFASSSSTLSDCFDKTILHATRRHDKYIGDYPQDQIVEFLFKEYGIPQEYSKTYTDRVGTRLRLLMGIVRQASMLPPLDLIIREEYSTVRKSVSSLMKNPSCAEYFDALSEGKRF